MKFFLTFIYIYVLPACIDTHKVCAMPIMKFRRECVIPWNWSYGYEPPHGCWKSNESSARAAISSVSGMDIYNLDS